MVRRTLIGTVPLIVLSACFLYQTRQAQDAWSITFDETLYLNCALQTVHDGWLDQRLSESGVGAVPVQLTTIPAALCYPRSNRPHEWLGTVDDPPINTLARRLNSILVGLSLLLVVYVWLWKRRGVAAAVTGGALVAFSPAVLAHSSLATTDACFALFSLVALASLSFWYHNPGWSRFLLAGVAIGLAIGSKYSGIFLFPVALALLLIVNWRKSAGSPVRRSCRAVLRGGALMVILFTVSMVTLWAIDWFSFTGPLKTVSLAETPPDSPWIQLLGDGPTARKIMDIAHRKLERPSVFGAVVARWLHNRTGHPAFLMGERSQFGWRWYFPCAWYFKSTPVEFVLSVVLLPLLLALPFLRGADEDESSRQTRTVWVMAIAVFWLMVCLAKVNIGHRYLLPLVPLTMLLSIDLLWLCGRRHAGFLGVVGAGLIAAQVSSAVSAAPHYLAYFSPFIGGPEQGRYYLSDSNLDWGQDLPALKRELERGGYQQPLLQYFGTAEPAAYGIGITHFALVERDQLDKFDVFALSVTHLQGTYFAETDPFAAFRELEPTATAAYSIALYDMRNPAVREALRTAWTRFPAAAREETRKRNQQAVGH